MSDSEGNVDTIGCKVGRWVGISGGFDWTGLSGPLRYLSHALLRPSDPLRTFAVFAGVSLLRSQHALRVMEFKATRTDVVETPAPRFAFGTLG
jgi:hypothetical protein